MMSGYSVMAGFGWLGMLLMALFWIGVIVLVVWGLTHVFSPRQPRAELDAEEILKQRYARGEISREEFVQAREALQ
jgi:putative membrane protein